MLITRLGVSRRGHRNLTGLRVDLVVPPVNVGLGDRLVTVHPEGKRGSFRNVVWLDGSVDLGTWAGDFHGVIRLVDILLLLDHLERCENSLRGSVQVSDSHRDLDAIASLGGLRRGRSHNTGFIDLDSPAFNSGGRTEALRRIFGQVAVRDLGVVKNRGSLVNARLRGLQFILRLVDLAVLALSHHSSDGEVARTIPVGHSNWNIRGRPWKDVRPNWRGDFTRFRVNLHLVPGEVARRCNVVRILRVSHEGEARLRSITQVRTVHLALYRSSDIAGHCRIRRLIRA